MVSNNDITQAQKPLLSALIQLKGTMSGREFASKLGISNRYWEYIRSGYRPIGLTMLEAIARTFPELDGYVLAHLRGISPPTELSQTEIKPIIKLAIGKSIGNSKVTINHNVKCPICGHIYRCRHNNNNSHYQSYGK